MNLWLSWDYEMPDVRYSRLLRSVAKAVDGATEVEIDALISMLERGAWKSKTPAVKPAKRRTDSKVLRSVLSDLSQAANRDEGQALLAQNELGRTDLEALSRLANVHVTKADTLPSIREKLVENMIGSRLNSEAIRGKMAPTKRQS